MEARLLRLSPGFARRLTSAEVSRKLQGPSRSSEGLVKHDHQTSEPILHFTHSQYNDCFVSKDELVIKESRHPGENAKLKSQMDDLSRREKTAALRTISNSGGAAILFAVSVKPNPSGPGWRAKVVMLDSAKRRAPLESRESKRFRSFFIA